MFIITISYLYISTILTIIYLDNIIKKKNILLKHTRLKEERICLENSED